MPSKYRRTTGKSKGSRWRHTTVKSTQPRASKNGHPWQDDGTAVVTPICDDRLSLWIPSLTVNGGERLRYLPNNSHVGQRDQIDQIDHDLDHLDPCRYERLCRICTVQIQPRKHVPRPCMLNGAHPATWPGSYRSYRSGIYLPWKIQIITMESMVCPRSGTSSCER